MKAISDVNLLISLVEKYGLNDLFEKDMTAMMTLYSFAKNESISKAAESLNTLYFLVSGKIGTYKLLENGKSLLLRFCKPLSIIGELEFLNNYPVQCNVEAQRDSLLIGIKYKDLYENAYDDPKFLRLIIQNLSHKLYTFSNASSINLLCPLENRLACYLISVNSNPEESTNEEIKVEKITEMAMLLGSSYRHLLRVIHNFVSKRLISYHRGSITILNYQRLKELARENIYE
jgi:CRP-like cAMP-binding protein